MRLYVGILHRSSQLHCRVKTDCPVESTAHSFLSAPHIPLSSPSTRPLRRLSRPSPCLSICPLKPRRLMRTLARELAAGRQAGNQMPAPRRATIKDPFKRPIFRAAGTARQTARNSSPTEQFTQDDAPPRMLSALRSIHELRTF